MQNFAVGDMISYGTNGVCLIENIKSLNFFGKTDEYYILKPVYDERSTVFVPIKNDTLVSRMKRIMKPEEIYALIRIMPSASELYVESPTERKKLYGEILSSGNREQLVKMIKTLYGERIRQTEKGKKFHSADEHFLKEAEKQLYEEFAYVLNITCEQVLPFIMNEIEISEKQPKAK